MLILADTNDVLRIVTSAAGAVDVNASVVDLDGTLVTPRSQSTAITTAATTTVVGAPAGTAVRNIKSLYIRNKHATTSMGVSVEFFDGTTAFEIFEVTLLAGEVLAFNGVDWTLFAAVGTVKREAAMIVTRALASDITNSTVTLAEVTGLKIAGVLPGIYTFIYCLVYQSAEELRATNEARVKDAQAQVAGLLGLNDKWMDALNANTAALQEIKTLIAVIRANPAGQYNGR